MMLICVTISKFFCSLTFRILRNPSCEATKRVNNVLSISDNYCVFCPSVIGRAPGWFKLWAATTYELMRFPMIFLILIMFSSWIFSCLFSSLSQTLSTVTFFTASPTMMWSASNEILVAKFYTELGNGCSRSGLRSLSNSLKM